MKKILAVILIFTTLFIYSEDIVIEPYGEDEFPTVLEDVRRASIIFCGAFPLGYMYSSIVLDQYFISTGMYEDLDDTDQSNAEIEVKLISSLIFSGVVMLIDLIIEKFFRGN